MLDIHIFNNIKLFIMSNFKNNLNRLHEYVLIDKDNSLLYLLQKGPKGVNYWKKIDHLPKKSPSYRFPLQWA